MSSFARSPASEKLCANCGAEATSRFCPDCGQNTSVGLPTLGQLLADSLGAIFSYDSKIWRTVWTLLRHPGQVTVDYLAGRRARYLSPLQTFFWLQTLAFLAHRQFFSDSSSAVDAKTRGLLVIGLCIAVGLSAIYAGQKLRFVYHLVVAVHIWAFLMLWLLFEYAVVPPAIQILVRERLLHGSIPEGIFITVTTQIAVAAYLTVSLRRIYRVSLFPAFLQTAILFAVYVGVSYSLNYLTGAQV